MNASTRADDDVSWLIAIVESSDDAILSKDLNGHIMSWNPGAERIFGYSRGEMIGQPILRLIPPERHSEETHILERIRRGERIDHYETVRRRKDGSLIHVSITVSPIEDHTGRIIGASKIARDITRQKRAEQQAEFLTLLSQQIGPLSDPDEILRVASREVGRQLGVDRCYFGQLDPDAAHVTITRDWAVEGRSSIAGIYRAADFGTPEMWTALAAGPFAVADTSTDLRTRGFDKNYDSLRVRAHASAPYVRDGRWTCGLTVTSEKPRLWQDDDLRLLENTVVRVWPLVEQARSLRDLRESERRQRELMQALPVACYTLDSQGRITFFNEAARLLWGRAPALGEAEWCGSVAMARLDGSPLPLSEGPAAIALREKRPVRGAESFVIRPDGARRWVVSNPDPVFDAKGHCVGVVNVVLDVTDEREAHEKSLRAAEYMNLAVSAANLGDWSWDAATDLVTFSPRACDIYGFPPGTSVTRNTLLPYVHPLDHESLAQSFQAALETRTDYDLEYRITVPDQPLRWVAVKGRPTYQADGRVAGMVGMAQDITARKEAEEALRDARARLEATLGAAEIGTWLWNTQTNRVYADRNLTRMFNLTAGEDGTSLETFVNAIHSEDQVRVSAEIQTALVSGTLGTDYRLPARDGKIRWVTARGQMQFDAAGRALYFPGVLVDITDRKEQEDVLIQLTRKIDRQARIFDSALSNITDFAYTLDRKGRFTYANKPLLDLWGLKLEEALGKNFFDLNYPAVLAEKLQRQIEHVVATGESVRDETSYTGANGETGFYEYILNPIYGSDDRIETVAGSTRVITERKRAEVAGEGQRRVMQLIAENAPLSEVLEELMLAAESVSPMKMAGSVLLLQDGVLRHGAAPHLPAAYNAAVDGMAIGPDMGSCGAAAWSKQPVYAGDLTQHPAWAKHQALVLAHGLRACWSTPILSSDGDLLGTFAMYFSEPREPTSVDLRAVDLVTRTAAIAIENKRAAAALRASEAQLRLVIDNAPVLLVRTNAAHVYTFVNRAYAERNGFTPQAMIGKHVSEVLGLEAYELVRPYMEAALAGERVEFERQVPYARLGQRWIHVVYVPDHDSAGNVTGLLAVISDIEHRKRAEEELKRARDDAVAASRAKDDFLAALSHELRTPLNPVLLLASDAVNNPDLPAAVRADFEQVRKNVDLEARLIDDLLDLTRISRGKLQLEQRPCDLELILQDAIANVSVDLTQKQLRLVSDFGAGKKIVLGDPVRLQQIFWNILKNAVKFTPPKGRVLLEVRSTDDGEWVSVKIADTGIGMTAEELERAFQAFAQGDHATNNNSGLHRFGGLGLGLAISKTLVDAHRGRIVATSPGRGQGAIFLVELPLCREPVVETPVPSAPLEAVTIADGNAGANGGSRQRILLVEDHAATRQTMRQLLINRHYDVTVAESAGAARQLTLPGKFDFIISDVGLPDRNGYELMAELRAIDPSLVGIALSGYGTEEDLARSKAAGFVVHLVKPVSIGALEAAIGLLPIPPHDYSCR